MDDYSDYSKDDEEDNDDGLDPGHSWFFDLTEFPLIKTPLAMIEMDWITKLIKIVVDSEIKNIFHPRQICRNHPLGTLADELCNSSKKPIFLQISSAGVFPV